MKVNVGCNVLTMNELADVCGGMLCFSRGETNRNIPFRSVCTDSREAERDALFVAREVAPKFAEHSADVLYSFAKRNAIMRNTEVVELCRQIAKEKRAFSLLKRIKLRVFGFYGRFRGTVKKVYYRLILRVKV